MSACVLAFAGGKFRYYRSTFGYTNTSGLAPKEEKNALGLHQFYVDDNREALDLTARAAKAVGIESAQVVMGVEMAYLAEMGVDPLLLTLASVTKPRDLYTLTEAEALHFKLAMPLDLQPEWHLKLYKQAVVAEGQGSFMGGEYRVSLWCPSHSKKQLRLAIKVKVWRDFSDDEIKPYRHYITTGELSSGFAHKPIKIDPLFVQPVILHKKGEARSQSGIASPRAYDGRLIKNRRYTS